MIRWLFSSLIDEFFGVVLLHEVLRFGDRPPLTGPAQDEHPDLMSGELSRFFAPQPPPADLTGERREVGRTANAVVEDFAFVSPVTTAFRRNNIVPGRHWRCVGETTDSSPDTVPVPADDGGRSPRRPPSRMDGESKRTLIVIDGLVQYGYLTERLFARTLNAAGIDVMTIDLPFNHNRTPANYKPGQLIVGGDLPHALSVMRQAVLDVWSLILGLQAQGREVALLGISFGGWTVLSTSLVAKNLASVTAVAPPIDMLRVLTEGGVIVRAAKRSLNLSPQQIADLVPVARAVNPSAWPAPLPPDRIFLHAADYDRFVPTDRILQLAKHWGTHLFRHPCGHIEITGFPPWIKRIALTVRDQGWADSVRSTPPARPEVMTTEAAVQ